MNNNLSIEFKNVSKSYSINRYKYRRISESIYGIFKKYLPAKKVPVDANKFWAVNNLNFKVKRGDIVGVIGRNGSGKTTILKLISKIIYPDNGNVNVSGRIGAFIELGAGLHPELSGRENIYLYGAILGMKRKEINQKFDDIVRFADIKKFLDMPIKKYSSGMYSRLGFSVCAFCDPDILLVDEVLAVGDINFQKKCLDKMHEFATSDKTIIFVSHDLSAISKICSKVMLLDKGRIKTMGEPKKVIDLYVSRYSKYSN